MVLKFEIQTMISLKWPLSEEDWKKVYTNYYDYIPALSEYLDVRFCTGTLRPIRPKLEKVLLESTTGKYDPVATWFAYMSLLERGEPLQRPYIFEIAPPWKGEVVSLDLFNKKTHRVIRRIDPLVAEFKLDQIAEAHAHVQRKLGKPVKYPRKYPMQPLERVLWNQAHWKPIIYNILAAEFNRSCPIWLLYYRTCFTYYANGTPVDHFGWSLSLALACP
jgi:hypothetical protein